MNGSFERECSENAPFPYFVIFMLTNRTSLKTFCLTVAAHAQLRMIDAFVDSYCAGFTAVGEPGYNIIQ